MNEKLKKEMLSYIDDILTEDDQDKLMDIILNSHDRLCDKPMDYKTIIYWGVALGKLLHEYSERENIPIEEVGKIITAFIEKK